MYAPCRNFDTITVFDHLVAISTTQFGSGGSKAPSSLRVIRKREGS